MDRPKIYAHGSYVGNTGYNQHTRDFFRALTKHADIKVRNFTIGNSWKGYNLTPHDEETYFNEVDKSILYQQILWEGDGKRGNYPIYPSKEKEFEHDLNIVLCETNHHLFYDTYSGPKIAYNVWETTLQPEQYFNKLLEFHEMWVPSKWQRDCMIKQGYPEDRIKVVPEGVDGNVFFPDDKAKHEVTSDGRFKFFLAGRWDYRKSIKEIIEAFLKTFDKDEPVDLIVSVDNPFSNDGMKTTEERLKHYGLEDDRIKVLHFPSREDYINILKSCDCFVSCARSEGWNLPLIEAMACGVPSIYSNCSGQLEFAEGRGIPVNILGEKPANQSSYNHFNEMVGNYYEPDFDHLSEMMRLSYEKYDTLKKIALVDSTIIRKEFSWERVAKIGFNAIEDFMKRVSNIQTEIKSFKKNKVVVTYLDGPRVEILGDEDRIYLIEFVNKDTGDVLHSETIRNNMWVACGKKYYIPWQIRINGEVLDELELEGENVLISMESKSLGDTLAWVPYSVEFAKKHKCNVIMSTFHNNLFEGLKEYKNIKFIKPGESHNCKSVYRLGWFRKNGKWEDYDRNPNQVNLHPLQFTATDILGLDFKELNYGINIPDMESPNKNKYVVFGPQATSGCKEWRYEYWVELSKMIKEKGYEVVTLTKTPFYIDGVTNVFSEPLESVINYLNQASAFVGLGSGLSWLNWAIGKHTYMINGFAKDGHEFTENVTRIHNPNVCISCWNDEVFVFDSGDWDWCPVYKGTKKQHICQRSITPQMVIEKMKL
jgi:autotransporter strand-loop-strand O-heptosyltransferase